METACNASLRDEEKTVEKLHDINRHLIENILPSHVAAKLLNSNQLTNVTNDFSNSLILDNFEI